MTDPADKPDDARIVLTFERKTLDALRQAILVRQISWGLGGLADVLVARLVEEIDAGTTDWRVEQKKPLD